MCSKNIEAKHKKFNLSNSHQSASWIIQRQLNFLEIFVAYYSFHMCKSTCNSSWAIQNNPYMENTSLLNFSWQFVFLMNNLYKWHIIYLSSFNSIPMAKVFLWNKMSQFLLHHLRNTLTLPNLVHYITCGPTLTSKNGT